jgi:hypothetical protein
MWWAGWGGQALTASHAGTNPSQYPSQYTGQALTASHAGVVGMRRLHLDWFVAELVTTAQVCVSVSVSVSVSVCVRRQARHHGPDKPPACACPLRAPVRRVDMCGVWCRSSGAGRASESRP